MFFLPSFYSYKPAIENIPWYFGSDREIFFDSVDPILLDYWNKKNIRYDFNKHMFRTSHDFSKLKHGEFILVIGCSHTLGAGIDCDSMYTSILEKELKIPVVNISCVSSDINMLLRNLSAWAKNFAKPKYLIVQVPDPARFSYMDDIDSITVVVPQYVERLDFKHLEILGSQYNALFEVGHEKLHFLQTIIDGYNIDTFYFSVKNLSEYENVKLRHPIVNFSSLTYSKILDYKKQYPEMKYLARDGSHSGDLVNLIWADLILDILRNKR